MPTRIPNPKRGSDHAGLNPEPDKLQEMARLLHGAFVWDASAEGGLFWSSVHARLHEMARAAEDKDSDQPPLPDPPARPSSLAASSDIRDALDQGANGVEVDYRPAIPEWSLYLCEGVTRHWIADYEIGLNPDQYTAEEAEALAFDYAERLLESFPQLRAHGINPKD